MPLVFAIFSAYFFSAGRRASVGMSSSFDTQNGNAYVFRTHSHPTNCVVINIGSYVNPPRLLFAVWIFHGYIERNSLCCAAKFAYDLMGRRQKSWVTAHVKSNGNHVKRPTDFLHVGKNINCPKLSDCYCSIRRINTHIAWARCRFNQRHGADIWKLLPSTTKSLARLHSHFWWPFQF